MKVAYVRDPGILAIIRRKYADGSATVCWFLDGIKTIEVVEVDEYIEVENYMFSGDLDV